MEKIWDLEKYYDNVAIINDSGESVRYSDFGVVSSTFAEHVNNRCLAFLLCSNTIGSIIGYVSFLNNGIVPALISSDLDLDLMEKLIHVYKPEIMWVPDNKSEYFTKHGRKLCGVWGYSLIKFDSDCDDFIFPELCLLLTTSGSTGSPKFVRQSYINVKSNAEAIKKYLEIDSTERPITTLPMNYTYGLSIINSHLMAGATLLVTEKGIMQKEFWDFFKEYKATSFGGVPYTYEMLNRLRLERMDLPHLRYMTQAGGKLTPELHRKFAQYARNTGKKFIVMYGQCEATARMGYLPADKSLDKCGSMGIAIPGGRFWLVDDDGIKIESANVPGELVYEGKNVTLGYAECRGDLSKGDERGGSLFTGDIATFDDEGYYYIVGRKKRFLKVFGNRVNLDEIERLVKEKFDNIEFACAGKDDNIFLFLTDKDFELEVKKYVVNVTKLNHSAFKTIVIESIPKNESGKTLYKDLVKYYE